MDRIDKILARFTPKEREVIKNILRHIMTGRSVGLNIKKLKGYNDIFRARIGKIRIIYCHKGGIFRLIAIERRSDTTYKKW